MPRTPAQAALDEVIREGLAPALKADGYRKDGHTFRRKLERCVQVVNVQSSSASTSDEVRFTINLGVLFPEVRQLIDPGWETGPRGPKEYECTVRQRIGTLLPGGRDRWWTLRPASWLRALDGTGPARVAEEVRAALARARPWLERMSDLRAAREHVSPWDAMALSLVLGDEAGARRIAEEVQRESPRAVAVLSWARERGLLP